MLDHSTTIKESDILEILPRIEGELQQYCWIQDHCRRTDVSASRDFQRRFNFFYKVILRSPEWYRHYYGLMEASKQTGATFPDILRRMSELTGKVEASFSSKLIATLDPNKPIIDKFVLAYFGLRLPAVGVENRIEKTVAVYDRLQASYKVMMSEPISAFIISRFSETYPWAHISDMKKVDFVLWQIRG